MQILSTWHKLNQRCVRIGWKCSNLWNIFALIGGGGLNLQYFINIQLREEIEDRPEKCFLRSVKADAQSLCTLLSTANICAGNEDKQRIHKRMWDVGSLYYTKMHSEVLQESETQTNKSKTCPNLNWDRLDRYSGNIYLVFFFFAMNWQFLSDCWCHTFASAELLA